MRWRHGSINVFVYAYINACAVESQGVRAFMVERATSPNRQVDARSFGRLPQIEHRSIRTPLAAQWTTAQAGKRASTMGNSSSSEGSSMPLRTLILGIVLVLVGLFAALNWSAIMAPTSLSLIFTRVDAPLGLVLLAIIGLLTVLFLVYLVYVQTVVLVDARRSARELQAQRELADQAEASRFTELRALLEERIGKLESVVREEQSRTSSRERHEVIQASAAVEAVILPQDVIRALRAIHPAT
jgi:uncharacterized integral membrane protein